MKYILSIILLIFIQSDWTENIEKSISRINKKGKLENEFEKKDKDGITIFRKYSAGKETKSNVKYKYGKLMDIDISFYENGELIFAEIISGKDVLIYKKKRLKDEPYAVLIENITYFKSNKEGIKKTRKIKVFENSNIEKLKKELKKIEFETEKIGEKEYLTLKEKYNRISKIAE
jgi:hypothetical protein